MENQSQPNYYNTTPNIPPLPQSKLYYVGINGIQEGPFTEAVLHEQVACGAIPFDVLVWTEGMPEWKHYNQIFAEAATDKMAAQGEAKLSRKNSGNRHSLALLSLVALVALGFFTYMFVGGDNKGGKHSGKGVATSKSSRGIEEERKKNELFSEAMHSLYGSGRPVRSQYRDSHAYHLMKKAAEAGHVQAQFVHGWLLLHGKDESKVKGIKWLKKAAEQNNAYAQEILAKAYFEGTGTQADEEKAIMWLKRAAGNKNLNACEKLLELYCKEKPVGISNKEAIDLAVNLYECGYLSGGEDILNLVEKGVKLPDGFIDVLNMALPAANDAAWMRKSSPKLWRIAKKLADDGNAWAQYICAEAYLSSDDEIEEGKEYVEKAVKQGHVMAAISLAEVYVKEHNRKATFAYRQILKQYPISAEFQADAWELWGGVLDDEEDND